MKDDSFKAIIDNRIDDLAAILRKGIDVNAVADEDTVLLSPRHIVPGDTLVHVALHTENDTALEMLLQYKANLNIASQDGVTPLQIAVNKAQNDNAMWLLENGANFNTMDKYGLTPLHYTNSEDIMNFILDRGVSVNLIAHSTGYTPLHYAAYHNRFNKAQFLIKHGAYTKARGHRGETPLHLLVAQRYTGDIEDLGNLLIENGADVNESDEVGNTPLHWAVGIYHKNDFSHFGTPRGIKFLLRQSANPKVKNNEGTSPLFFALSNNNKEIIDIFHDSGVEQSFFDKLRGGF